MAIGESEKPKDPKIFCKSLRYYFREYCNASSIHGFRYFGEKRTYFERTWWFIVFCLVLAGCAYCIRLVYMKWEDSPVIVSFDTRETKIHNIPFPAVTICPQAMMNLTVFNPSSIYRKIKLHGVNSLSYEEQLGTMHSSVICSKQIPRPRNYNISTLYIPPNILFDIPPPNGNQILEFLKDTEINNIMSGCSFMKKQIKCSKLFVPILTDHGICYTFNMLDREDIYQEKVVHYEDFLKHPNRQNLTWDIATGYKDGDSIETYPQRAKFPGVQNGLTVKLSVPKKHLDYLCNEAQQGWKVLVHIPMRLPRTTSHYIMIPLHQRVLAAVNPIMIGTTETVKMFPATKRMCFFNEDRQLKFFKIYTQLNCQLECLRNLTESACRCVPFYMPREKNTPICHWRKRNCWEGAQQYMAAKELNISMSDLVKKKNKTNNVDNADTDGCNCLPMCSDLTYGLEISQAKWSHSHSPLRSAKSRKEFASKLTIYFKTSQFVISKRHELFGIIDLLANFGGLLGLFCGFSMLSIIELIYFLSLRLFCNHRLYGRWYGPQN